MTHPTEAHDCGAACPLVDRRTFLSQGTLAAIALALAACAGSDGPTSPGTVSQLTLTLANYPALANVGGVAYVTDSGTPIAVVRTSASAFVALSRICPHQGGIVESNGSGFTCPVHGARFNASGSWVGGQRTSSLTSYPATYDSTAGTVTIG